MAQSEGVANEADLCRSQPSRTPRIRIKAIKSAESGQTESRETDKDESEEGQVSSISMMEDLEVARGCSASTHSPNF